MLPVVVMTAGAAQLEAWICALSRTMCWTMRVQSVVAVDPGSALPP